MSDMPAKILARPMMGVADRHCGPWALDDPYENAVEYHHADAVNALVEAATAGLSAMDELIPTGTCEGAKARLRIAIAAIKGPAE